MDGVNQRGVEPRRLIREETGQIAECKDPVGIGVGLQVELHSFRNSAKFHRVRAPGQECIVRYLERIPTIKIRWASAHSSGERRKSCDTYLSCGSPRHCAQREVRSVFINGGKADVVVYAIAVVAETNRIDQRCTEGMCLFQHEYLPPCQVAQQDVVQTIRGTIRSVVEDVCSENTIFIRQLMIQPRCGVVFVHDLLCCKPEEGRVTQTVWCEASVWKGKEGEILANRRIDLYRRDGSVAVMNEPITHVFRRYGINARNPLGLP